MDNQDYKITVRTIIILEKKLKELENNSKKDDVKAIISEMLEEERKILNKYLKDNPEITL